MEKVSFKQTLLNMITLASTDLLAVTSEIGYTDHMYFKDELERLRVTAMDQSQILTNQIFGQEAEIDLRLFASKASVIEGYIKSMESSRSFLWPKARVQAKHINETEAKRKLDELQKQSAYLQNKAQSDEQQKKLKEEAVLDFLYQNNSEFEKIKKEIEQPNQYQKRDIFTKKFALIFCNEKYNNTILMQDLPAVKDDNKNMKLCVQMLNIPQENVFEFNDISHDEMKAFYSEFSLMIIALAKELKQATGIGGKNLLQGLEWDRLKQSAMQENQPTDRVRILLKPEESETLKQLIGLQREAGQKSVKFEGKSADGIKICNMQWKLIKQFALEQGYDPSYLDFQLTPPEQQKLIRYIEMERKYPNFLTTRDPKDLPQEEILIFAYTAGHGCATHEQFYLLNENKVDKIFWPFEEKLQKLGELGGSNLKVVGVYDICREPYEPLKNKIEEVLKKAAEGSKRAPVSALETDPDEEEEELKEVDLEAKKDARGVMGEDKRPLNYFSIYGTTAGGLVAAKSNLAIEVLQQFILKALNLRGEVVFPDDFNDFKGVDGKTVVTNNTDQFSLQFGYKSTFDKATETLFKQYAEKAEDPKINLTYFEIFMEYQDSMLDLQQSIVWGKVDKQLDSPNIAMKKVLRSATIKETEAWSVRSNIRNAADKFTACVFGECGQGKSTALSEISKLFASERQGAKAQKACKFESGKSFAAVTSCVKVARTGNMTLIDTPGFNDSDIRRSDKNILIELINTVRPIVTDENQGITSFVQCIMPDESDRIRQSSVKGMNNMLLALNSFDYQTDISNHPMMNVIFNNVSLQEENEKDQSRIQDRIDQYKLALKANAKRFYLSEVSEDTIIGEKPWLQIKKDVCSDDTYKNAAWFTTLPKDKRELIEMLREIQMKGDPEKPIKPQPNPLMEKLIETRIDQLFPNRNFYFFKIWNKGDSDPRMETERDQLRKLIGDNVQSDRFYIKSGLLEPVHLQEEERKLIVEGMQTSLAKMATEIKKSQELSYDATQIQSQSLLQRLEETLTVKKKFDSLARDKPWTFQKCSLHGMILAKECISKVRDEANEQCQRELAERIEEQQTLLDVAKENIENYMQMFGLVDQSANLTQKEKIKVVLEHQKTMKRQKEEKAEKPKQVEQDNDDKSVDLSGGEEEQKPAEAKEAKEAQTKPVKSQVENGGDTGLKKENEALRKENERLRQEIEELKRKLGEKK